MDEGEEILAADKRDKRDKRNKAGYSFGVGRRFFPVGSAIVNRLRRRVRNETWKHRVSPAIVSGLAYRACAESELKIRVFGVNVWPAARADYITSLRLIP
jgi:hypothetical protein